MAGKAIKRDTIKRNTVAQMKKLGTYKAEYEAVINIYCEMREQYELYLKKLKEKHYKCDEFTAAGGTKKSALITTIETLRKDILLYSDRLKLNPKSFDDKVGDKNKGESKLAKALDKLG